MFSAAPLSGPTDAVLGIVNLVCIGSDSAEIATVVRSDHRRPGIGRALVEHAFQRAGRDGFSQLFGYVLAENRPEAWVSTKLTWSPWIRAVEQRAAIVS
jgi:GNAT superfamily N-acetyltransferase